MSKVEVCIRIRPLHEERSTTAECIALSQPCLDLHDSDIRLTNRYNGETSAFTFSQVWGPDVTNEEIWRDRGLGQRIVSHARQGYDVCLFAYGVTGSGKSHTVRGTAEDQGVLPRLCADLFRGELCPEAVYVSHVEIYNDKVYDLLASVESEPLKVTALASLVILNGVQKVRAANAKQLNAIVMNSASRLTCAKTQCNAKASRSHSVVTLYLAKETGLRKVRMTRINIVDLAGNEHTRESKVQGALFKETCRINASLTALGRVIAALSSETPTHVPFRDNVLTMLLSTSLSGHGKTFLIATACPTTQYYHDTVRTLLFARHAEGVVQSLQVVKEVDAQISELITLEGSGGTDDGESIRAELTQWYHRVKKDVSGLASDLQAISLATTNEASTISLCLQRVDRDGYQGFRKCLDRIQPFVLHSTARISVEDGHPPKPKVSPLWAGDFCIHNGHLLTAVESYLAQGDILFFPHAEVAYYVGTSASASSPPFTLNIDTVLRDWHKKDCDERLQKSQDLMRAAQRHSEGVRRSLELYANPEVCWLSEYRGVLLSALASGTMLPTWERTLHDFEISEGPCHLNPSPLVATSETHLRRVADLQFFTRRLAGAMQGPFTFFSFALDAKGIVPHPVYAPRVMFSVEGTGARRLYPLSIDPLQAIAASSHILSREGTLRLVVHIVTAPNLGGVHPLYIVVGRPCAAAAQQYSPPRAKKAEASCTPMKRWVELVTSSATQYTPLKEETAPRSKSPLANPHPRGLSPSRLTSVSCGTQERVWRRDAALQVGLSHALYVKKAASPSQQPPEESCAVHSSSLPACCSVS